MSKRMPLVMVVMLSSVLAQASICPVMLVSGAGDRSGITVTFRNAGKFAIRRLEFNCKPLHGKAGKGQEGRCREENALFYPGTTYTVSYVYPGGVPQPVIVSLKNATLSDGHIWKPTKHQPCRVLRIHPDKSQR